MMSSIAKIFTSHEEKSKSRSRPRSIRCKTTHKNGVTDEIGYYVDEKKEGEWHQLHPNGKLKSREFYVNGQKHGICKYWDENESLLLATEYVNGEEQLQLEQPDHYSEYKSRNGPFTFRYPNGQKMIEGTYINGKEHGDWKEWYESGQMHHCGLYVEGKKHGLFKYWGEDGRVYATEVYIYGKLQSAHKENTPEIKESGEYTSRYPSGKLKVQTYHVLGEPHGEYKEWYENGQLAKHGFYLDGKEHGKFQYWHEDGRLNSEKEYTHGELQSTSYDNKTGLHMNLYPNGKIKFKVYLVKGLKHGEYKEWYENGQLSEHGFYLNGEPDGEWKLWYENGQMLEHGFYSNGKEHGKFQYWHEDGRLNSEKEYVNGELQELYPRFDGTTLHVLKHSNGTTRAHQICSASGQLHGEYKEWYDNGQLFKHGSYSEGKENGEFREWNEDGSFKSVKVYIDGEEQIIPESQELKYEDLKLIPDTTDSGIDWAVVTPAYSGGRVPPVSSPKHWDPDLLALRNKLYSEGYHNVEPIHREAKYPDGPYCTTYPNGQSREYGTYVNGERDGEWFEFYSNGNLKMSTVYVNGLLHGKFSRWNEDGFLAMERSYVYGREQGV